MYHTIILAGRVAKDPELRYIPSGKAVTTFTLAVDDGWGESKKTLWFRVTVWDKQAETANTYLKKGKQVLIEGRLTGDDKGNPKTFTRQDGTAGASFEVTANVMRFIGSREEGSGGSASGTTEVGDGGNIDGGDLPF